MSYPTLEPFYVFITKTLKLLLNPPLLRPFRPVCERDRNNSGCLIRILPQVSRHAADHQEKVQKDHETTGTRGFLWNPQNPRASRSESRNPVRLVAVNGGPATGQKSKQWELKPTRSSHLPFPSSALGSDHRGTSQT